MTLVTIGRRNVPRPYTRIRRLMGAGYDLSAAKQQIRDSLKIAHDYDLGS